MPDSAAGKTTRRVVCIRLAPIASEPWRIDWGTADIASSAREAIVGSTITPRTSPAASELVKLTLRLRKSCSSVGVTNLRAKKP